ncbi:MAG: hypothetical protein ACD_62C00281G0005 [uncultured bacterium]|nr:MAG: hypothetical protein ACD_62C00281G0005 [uncultured bacterium]
MLPLPQCSNYTVKFSGANSPSPEACLFLHGFPAASREFPMQEKNQDIAAAIAQHLGMDSFVTHYRGLGLSKGRFSFIDSIEESCVVASTLVRTFDYRKVHLVGHSWGGVVALNVFERLASRQGNLILLSPFTVFPDRATLKQVLISLCASETIDFKYANMDLIVEELGKVEEKYNPQQLASRIIEAGGKVLLIQAIHDDEVPASVNRAFCSRFPTGIEYAEIDTDHKFSRNRDQLLSMLIRKLRKHDHV